MKKYILLLLAISTVPVNSQLIYDKWDDIVPFSQSEKYKEIIDASSIHSMVLSSYNNDSLFRKANNGKSRSEIGGAFAAGFHIDTTIDIRKYGKRIDIEEGSLWIYTIESKTAESLTPRIKKFNVPDGAYLSFITIDWEQDPETFTKESLQDYHKSIDLYVAGIDGRRAIIEYFEPKEVISDFPILLYQVTYYYAGILKRNPALKTDIHSYTIF